MKKFFLILGIVVLVVIIFAVVFICVKKDQLMLTAVEQMQSTVVSRLPADAPQDSLETVFTKAMANMKNKKVSPQKIQNLLLLYQSSLQDKAIDSLEADNIFRSLGEIASPKQSTEQ